jgi:hypothetical protein
MNRTTTWFRKHLCSRSAMHSRIARLRNARAADAGNTAAATTGTTAA